MSEMTPRERVVAALNHHEPDRVPLDIGGGTSTTQVIEGYEKLKEHLGIIEDTKMMLKVLRMARMDESVMRYLGSDVRPLTVSAPVNWTPPPSDPDTVIDIWGIHWKKVYFSDSAYYYDVVKSPLADADIEDIEKYPWPDPLDPGYTADLEDKVKALYDGTDYAIMADAGFKSFWELGYMLRGYEQLITDLILNPKFVSALMNKLLEINIAGTGRFLDIAGPYIQVFRTADDLATQGGPLFSPNTYRELIQPVYKEFYKFIKSKTEAKIFYHSCGNIVDMLDLLIENGVEIINPVQVSAIDIDTKELKARFGDKLTFWGAIDTQKVLPFGTEKDVEAEVKKRINDLGPGGGFVVAPVHTIQADVPPQNIVAMAESTRKFGKYPLTG
ncbi:MAG TPA: uroporphyrinogen decarboxylase family protein [Spirochaetota bacterium]|nr:uroporphyrinogen decarboxylase family protein [Spirochaetota bacterium]